MTNTNIYDHLYYHIFVTFLTRFQHVSNMAFSTTDIATLATVKKNCQMLELAYFMPALYTHSVILMFIIFKSISVFKTDESLVCVMKSVGL